MKEYILKLYQDVPESVFEGVLSILCLSVVVILILKGFKKGVKDILRVILWLYLFLIYGSTVFFRTDDSNNIGYNFSPFWSYRAINKGLVYLWEENVLNILVFIPIGLLISITYRRINWWLALFIGFGISLSVETLQFGLHKGFSEFDDVFHNTLGCGIGILIVAIIKGIWLLQKRYSSNHSDNANHN